MKEALNLIINNMESYLTISKRKVIIYNINKKIIKKKIII